MINNRENAKQFLNDFGNGKSWVDRLIGVDDFLDLLTQYSNKTQNKYFPNDSHSFEVFSIKDSSNFNTKKEAFIGFKLGNGDFHFLQVPFTEPVSSDITLFQKLKKFIKKILN